ncbi:hypothetical protein MUK42_18541 [Musa troglodytarum]|uniref:Uncharacterized protein n=1 Tax=Musa troglodytarum TaxID=320322 RepID=A0A9E7F9A3_9LILI|nr:hypothetical protein MUK42_18541 [Musa troglodytarum]
MATTARLSVAIAVLVVLGSLCGLSQLVVAEEVHRLDGQRSAVVSADQEKGTKIVIIPCVKHCDTNGECQYCCIAAEDPPCYKQLEQCQANCIRCDPKCPPAPRSMETRP